jgi:hypothetical protein
MFGLRRLNALTPEQGRILAKVVRGEPVSPASLRVLDGVLK